MTTETRTTKREIAEKLSDAIGAIDEAYDLAVEAWGKDDPRTAAINSAWAEVDTALTDHFQEEK